MIQRSVDSWPCQAGIQTLRALVQEEPFESTTSTLLDRLPGLRGPEVPHSGTPAPTHAQHLQSTFTGTKTADNIASSVDANE